MEPTTTSPTSDATKTCLDCAETVKAAARVCRYCGYEYGLQPALPPIDAALTKPNTEPGREMVNAIKFLLIVGTVTVLLIYATYLHGRDV